MANGKAIKRLGKRDEKSEVVRIRLKNAEWAIVDAMVACGTAGNRTKPSRASAIEALVMAGLFCFRYHPDRYQEAVPIEATKALDRGLRRVMLRGRSK